MNGFYLVGRICFEPEKMLTSGGLPMCRLYIAVNKSGKENSEENDIFEVVVFRNLAEMDYQKGQLVAVNGKVQANNFEKEGNVYYHANLLGNSLSILS
jgi:single-stranded DNA-binding protein